MERVWIGFTFKNLQYTLAGYEPGSSVLQAETTTISAQKVPLKMARYQKLEMIWMWVFHCQIFRHKSYRDKLIGRRANPTISAFT
jgi:hypothetical protein